MPTNAVNHVYNRWERFLNDVSRTLGGDRELEELSNKLTDLKADAFRDGQLTGTELDRIYTQMSLITEAYAQLAKDRGYPLGDTLPTTKAGFKVYEEGQEIHFQLLAGEDLQGGLLGDLVRELNGRRPSRREVASLTKKVAFDLITSADRPVAIDKLNLIRSRLARVDDPTTRREALEMLQQALSTELANFRRPDRPAPLDMATFEAKMSFRSTVGVHKVELPDQVKGSGAVFPNKFMGAAWEAEVRKATAAGLDDLQSKGQLFLDKFDAADGPKTVAMKLDLNFGADGPPTVSEPASTWATLTELLGRAQADGKEITFTVGDSAGGENVPLGRTTMDIMRDTGNYHYALKAGLQRAAQDGSAEAEAALAKIAACEAQGVFFGGRDDKTSTPADLAAAEAAASRYVRCVDYDKEGYTPVDPELGPMGLAAWGTREFQMAKPWVEADYRVHVARSASTHIMAGWTGATKGLIGLHAFGRRPVDQGMNKRGENILTMGLLSHAGGFLGVFANRTGFDDIVGKVRGSGDGFLSGLLDAAEGRWSALRSNTAAWKHFESGVIALGNELKRDQQGGASEVELMDKMRWRTRKILDEADALSPGFRQATWDAVAEQSRFALRAAASFRWALPAEMKDEQAGARIGLLTKLPYPSDLVIQNQVKIGTGGGPDAYREVHDVGALVVATDEPTADAAAWRASGRTDNIWAENFPVNSTLMFGHGPMGYDEMDYVSGG